MQRDELRALQAPLKEHYAQEPGASRAQRPGARRGRPLCKLTERHCVVYQSLANTPALSATVTNA